MPAAPADPVITCRLPAGHGDGRCPWPHRSAARRYLRLRGWGLPADPEDPGEVLTVMDTVTNQIATLRINPGVDLDQRGLVDRIHDYLEQQLAYRGRHGRRPTPVPAGAAPAVGQHTMERPVAVAVRKVTGAGPVDERLLCRTVHPDDPAEHPGGHQPFACPECGLRSSHPDDIRDGYCGACHASFGPDAARQRLELFELGRAGLVDVPAYTVGTGPDGGFQVVYRDGTGPDDRAVIAGDCWRRFAAGAAARDGLDPFADLRDTPWVGPWPGVGAVVVPPPPPQGPADPAPTTGGPVDAWWEQRPDGCVCYVREDVEYGDVWTRPEGGCPFHQGDALT